MAVTHTFIDGLRADTEVCYTTSRGKHEELHLSQSTLDSACGPHCVAMALMILTGIRRRDIELMSTSKNPALRALWQRVQQHWFEGTTRHEVADHVRALEPALASSSVTGSATKLAAASLAAVRERRVPIVRVYSRSFDHWSICVGVECENTEVRALLLLDPAAPAPWMTLFNARLDLVRTGGRRQYPHVLRDASGERWNVVIEELVIVRRGQPP